MGLGSKAVEMTTFYFMTTNITFIYFISHEQVSVFKDGSIYCVCILGPGCLVTKEMSTVLIDGGTLRPF